jgi:hypothetical protein
MDQLPALGTSIQDIVLPTFKIYAALLPKNAETILSVRKETFSYGPLERQQLDIYHPPKPTIVNGRKAVLLFEYGGGFHQGAKTLPVVPNGLCYANLAAFFALKYGYTVVIADYRLISHGAKFPSGGEDISLALEWILSNPDRLGTNFDLFAMGNSAGGVHVCTFLLHPSFAELRKKLTTGEGPRLRGVVFLAVPFHFHDHHPSRKETLEGYFGDHYANCPLGMLKSARSKGQIPLDFVEAGVRVFVLDGERDDPVEIRVPRDDFVKEWMELGDNGSRSALAVDTMARHNHISPPLALSTGDEEEEAWGHQVGAFFENIRKFKLSTSS